MGKDIVLRRGDITAQIEWVGDATDADTREDTVVVISTDASGNLSIAHAPDSTRRHIHGLAEGGEALYAATLGSSGGVSTANLALQGQREMDFIFTRNTNFGVVLNGATHGANFNLVVVRTTGGDTTMQLPQPCTLLNPQSTSQGSSAVTVPGLASGGPGTVRFHLLKGRTIRDPSTNANHYLLEWYNGTAVDTTTPLGVVDFYIEESDVSTVGNLFLDNTANSELQAALVTNANMSSLQTQFPSMTLVLGDLVLYDTGAGAESLKYSLVAADDQPTVGDKLGDMLYTS